MRNSGLVLSAFIVGLAGAVPCRAANEFITDMRKAEGYKEDPDKIEFYGRAISAWAPGDGNALLAECHFRRGEARFRAFDYAAAESDLSKAVELDPMNAQARLLRGRARLKTGHAAAGLADLVEYAAANPESVDGLLWLGEAYRDNGKFPQALHAFDRASKLDAADYRPALGRGRVWLAGHEWDKAAVALKAADALARHKSADVLSALGDCEQGRGHREKAQDYFDEALAGYRRACESGDESACRKADALAAKPARPAKNLKKASAPAPSDAGDRVYAN